jgi:phosphoglycerate dehydrogenase-like enzyme
MKVLLCARGLTRIRGWLQEELPEDRVLECSAAQVVAAAADADVLIPTVSAIDESALAQRTVRLVQQFGAGLDTVDVAAASRRGVLVANVPTAETANADSVAELAIFFMLALARRFPGTQEFLKTRRIGGPVGNTIAGKSALIVGFGGIGRALARRLVALGVRVLAVSRRGPRGDDVAGVARHVAAERLRDLLPEADFIVVATPLDQATRGLVGAREFALAKPGAFLVNVARGGIVDRHALVEALRDGRLAGAGIDVFWEEPVSPEDPLLQLNVIATPHIGGSTEESLHGIARRVAENVSCIRAGRMPRNCVNRSAVDGRALRDRWAPAPPPSL